MRNLIFFPDSAANYTNDNPHFTKPCSRVAVCLYGQYRTGDFVLPELAKTFSSSNPSVQVDWFASVKCSKSYSHSATEHKKYNGNIVDRLDLSVEELQNKLDTAPVKFAKTNIIEMDYDERVGGIKWGKLFHAVADVIHLKQMHEIENNYVYDIVILTRFDVVPHTDNALERMINWYNGISDNEFRVCFNGAKFNNWIATDLMGDGLASGGMSGVQDYFTWGGSQAYDILYTTMLDLLRTMKRVRTNSVSHHGVQSSYDGHVGFNLASKNGVGFSNRYPYLSGDDNLCFMEEFFLGGGKQINTAWDLLGAYLVREVPGIENIDLLTYEGRTYVTDWWLNDAQNLRDIWNEKVKSLHKGSDEQDDS